MSGVNDIVIAGGVQTMSKIPLLHPPQRAVVVSKTLSQALQGGWRGTARIHRRSGKALK